MRKDSLREYMHMAIEAYNLAATPQPGRLYKETQDESEPLDAYKMPTDNRRQLLNLSIDIKSILDQFIQELPPKRAERFMDWLQAGYIERFHSDHREQIKRDRKLLEYSIIVYRTGRPPY